MGMITVKQIADDLLACNVMSYEEVNTITCEKVEQEASRMMIYMILNKGSEACNILVRSLEKHNPFLFHDLQGYCTTRQVEQAELNGLIQDLKYVYLSSAFQKYHPLGCDIDIIFDLETSYTDVLLWKKDIHNSRKGQLTLNVLLEELKNPCIIEGEAGKGKTTLLKRIAVLWASDNSSALKKFQFVFFISLTSTRGGIYKTVCDQLLFECYPICEQEFMKMLLAQRQRVLFLLDGYDEFKPQNCPEIEAMIKENHKFKNMVIISTRTESIHKIRQFGSLIAEIGDLSEESCKKLIKNVLTNNLADGLLNQLEEATSMKNLMKTPLFVIIACAIQMGESNFHPSTQTLLFSTLYKLMVAKNRYKTKEITEKHIMLSINHCGDLALDGIFDQRFDFQSEDLADVKEEVLLASGLLNKYTAQRLKPTYRFFHKSFQEYTAGRKLCKLLTSCQEAEVKKGYSYLQKINTISDISNTYFNLLLYTCGSSPDATRIILDLLKRIDQHRDFSQLLSLKNLALESKDTKPPENITEKEDLNKTDKDILADCVINFFYESSSKSALSRDFEEFFCNKSIYINTQNIPIYFSDFFRYLPNCVSVLGLIKLDFFGNYSPNKETDNENVENLQISSLKTYIPEKAVSLFFNCNQSLKSLEITLQDFNKLKKHDIKYLGKICCSAASLKLRISNSAGITGTLSEVLETCKNLEDLTVESTPLTVEDEKQITAMAKLKTLHIRDLQSENLEGGLIDGIKKLVNAEGLVFDNISMDEGDAKKIAEGIRNLRKLRSLYMNHLTAIGDGITCIVNSLSDELSELEEIQLVNCCISSDAVEILAQNLCNLPKLNVLDLSENYLEKKGKDAIHRLVDGLNVLPGMKVLMLPWGDDVKVCLTKLLELLETMPQLTKLGLRKWSLTDAEVRMLGNFFEKEHLENLQHLDLSMNCVTSDGWLSFMQPLISLKKLVSVDFSSKRDWVPASLLVCKLSQEAGCFLVPFIPGEDKPECSLQALIVHKYPRREPILYTRQLQTQQKKAEESLGHFCKKRWPTKDSRLPFPVCHWNEGTGAPVRAAVPLLLAVLNHGCLYAMKPLTLCYLLISTCTCEFCFVPESASKLFHLSPCALPVKTNAAFSL